jgi:adenylate cyclase
VEVVGKRFFYGLLVVLLAFAATAIAEQAQWLAGAENAYYDVWHQLAGVRYHPAQVVIVAIDEATRLEHHDEPLVFWAPHFARAIEVLKKIGARVIGLDVLFAMSAEAWLKRLNMASALSRTHDLELRRQLASGQVILAGTLVMNDQGESKVLLPIADYYYSLPKQLDDIGLTNFYNDPDGVLRRFVTRLSDSGGESWPTLAALLASRAQGGGQAPKARPPASIRFAGPPGTFPRVSFRRLLLPGAEEDPALKALRDKVVIVGWESGLQDIFLTPYASSFLSWRPRLMSGAEVHANIVETLLTGHYPRPLPHSLGLLLLLAGLAFGTACFFYFPPWKGLGVGLGLVLGLLALSYVLFLQAVILPVANLEMGLSLCYLGVLVVRLTREERTRRRLRQLFSRYVADEVVERLLTADKLPDLGGDALHVTILFADIRNFTTISEQLSPHEVVEMLNTYFGQVCEIIWSEGGTVDKFIGDAVMAMFGAPVPHPDHARRALTTALAMSARAQEFQAWMAQRFRGRNLPEFQIGVGVHSGEAVVGNIGTQKKMEFTSIGDAVNIASRLEGLTKQLGWKVIASEATIVAAGTGVITGLKQEMQVKGRQAAVGVYEVLGFKASLSGEAPSDENPKN